MNGLFDTHAHLNDEKFDEDRESVILSLKENGISYVVIPSDTFKSSLKTVEIVGKYDFLYGAVGILKIYFILFYSTLLYYRSFSLQRRA